MADEIRETVSFPGEVAESMRQRGVDTQGFDLAKPIPAQDLEKAGVVAVNVIGDAERGIVEGTDELDLRNKVFLTQQDLDQMRPLMVPEGVDNERLQEISQDMLQFVHYCQHVVSLNRLLHPEVNPNNTWGAQARNFIRQVKSAWDKKQAKKFITGWFYHPAESLSMEEETEISKQVLEDIQGDYKDIPKEVRGIPVENIHFRAEGGNWVGRECPVLSCNHRFSEKMGLKIVDDGSISGDRGVLLRINEATAHLVSHGISSTRKSEQFDQRYITIREYLRLFEKRNKDKDSLPNPEEVRKQLFLNLARVSLEKVGVQPDNDTLEKLVEEVIQYIGG